MLTEKYIQSLKPRGSVYWANDYDGLSMRISPTGSKSWYYRYTIKGTRNQDGFSLGKYRKVYGLASARKDRDHWNTVHAEGKDPKTERRKAKEKQVSTMRISQYPDFYVNQKQLGSDSEQAKRVKRDINDLTKFLGDREPHEYSKLEIGKYIRHRLLKVSTGTVSRNFKSINAVVNYVYEEQEIDYKHRFRKPKIPNKGEDKKERQDFTPEQLAEIREAIKGTDNPREQIMGLLIDTGMRVSEAVGLASEDVRLNCPRPHINLNKNTFRRLKTKNSVRYIPLVGTSLEVAKSLDLSGEWLFPSYLDREKNEFKGTSASNAINKRIRKILGSKDVPTSHSFRHTIATRLRQAQCPASLREEIGGWRSTDPDQYGQLSDIKIKADYLEASIDWKKEF
jgi:integrase